MIDVTERSKHAINKKNMVGALPQFSIFVYAATNRFNEYAAPPVGAYFRVSV
jgi:hypothetical protein